MDVQALFPEGVEGLGGGQFLVKTGPYFEVVAERDLLGDWSLTALGTQLTGVAAPEKPKVKGKAKGTAPPPNLDLDLDV